MQLRTFYINQEISCSFQEGLNIILGCNIPDKDKDDQEKNETGDTNGVGKTMIINCIRYCLGLEVSHIFSLNYFEDKKFWARLEVIVDNKLKVFIRPMWKSVGEDRCFIYRGGLANFLKNVEEI